MSYLIINIQASQAQGQLIFWGKQRRYDSSRHIDAIAIDEEYVNINLERYDNGVTTRAVLLQDVINRPDEVRASIGLNVSAKEGEAA